MSDPVQISGGRYPLIQTPSPFAQLATVLQGIQAQRAARAQEAMKSNALQAEIDLRNAEAEHQQAATAEERQKTRDALKAAEDAAATQHRYQMAIAPLVSAYQQGVAPSDEAFLRLQHRSEGALEGDPAARALFHTTITQLADEHTHATTLATGAIKSAADAAKAQSDAETAARVAQGIRDWNANPANRNQPAITSEDPGAYARNRATEAGQNFRQGRALAAAATARTEASTPAKENQGTAIAGARAAVEQMKQALAQDQGAGSQGWMATVAAGMSHDPDTQQMLRGALSSNPQIMYRSGMQQFGHTMSRLMGGSRSAPLFNSLLQGFSAPPGHPEMATEFVKAADAAVTRAELAHQRGVPLESLEFPEMSAFGAATGIPSGPLAQPTVQPLAPGSLGDPGPLLGTLPPRPQ
jgi:hypothetical protein